MSADETNQPRCGLKFPFPALIFLKQPADVLNHLQNLLPFSCYSQCVGSQSINPLCQQKLILIFAPNHDQLDVVTIVPHKNQSSESGTQSRINKSSADYSSHFDLDDKLRGTRNGNILSEDTKLQDLASRPSSV